MATPFLRITNGTTNCTFLNSTTLQTYFIEANEWAPAVAGLRKSPFGGVSPYEDVVEEINCRIRDTTAAACYAALETLALLLDQAERWTIGDNVTAVKIQFSPTGSTVSSDSSPLQAVILGRADGDETNGVGLQPEWDDVARCFMMPIRIRFRRRGLWLGESESATSSSGANPSILTATLATTHNMYSPVKVALNSFTGGMSTRASGYLLVTRDANHLSIVEAEGLTASKYTSVADSGANARGGSVLRYTPTGIGGIFSFDSCAETTLASGFRSGIQRFGVFIAARNNSATANYYVRATAYYVDNLGNIKSTNFTKIAANATAPAIYYLGLISLPSAEKLYLDIWCDLVNQSLDIDYICLIRFDDECSRVIAHQIVNHAVSGGGGTAVSFTADDRSLTKPEPAFLVSAPSVSQEYGINYSGNPYLVTKGNAVSAVWLSTFSSSWKSTASGGGAVISNTITATRLKAYLAPK
jgi:hypothetical protein